MIFEQVVVGPFMCNCTILGDEETKEAVIIDPGDDAQKILDAVRSLGVTVKSLVHTHCHLDHIVGTRAVKEALGPEICLHEGDLWLYQNLMMQASMFGFQVTEPLTPERMLKDGDTLQVGKHALKVVHTPGHTPGSVCFSVEDDRKNKMIFSGDTLFQKSIGRTDLWGGSYDQIIQSIQGRLLTQDDDTRVLPGHGPHTTIGAERKKNPFLQ